MNLDFELIKNKLPKRPVNSNKGTFGSALIIAGSKNYPGAAILSVLASFRSGAGFATLATGENVYKVVVPKIPFATFLDFSEIEENLEKYDSVLIGPGLGKSETAVTLVKELINSSNLKNKKIILDADALNILSEIKDWFEILDIDAILTPHPGEMARLTGLSIQEIQNNRQKIALKFSKLWNKTIILKGAETVITTPKGETFTAEFANPLLATAGTGDVLSGIVVSLLSQGLSLIDAAIVGVYIHGIAAKDLKNKFGDRGMTALDLVEEIPNIFTKLSQKSV